MALQTVLHDWHQERGARMIDFGGWDMPVHYTSIVAEHEATRGGAGLFDISHMGRLRFEGPDAQRFLDHVLTNRVDNLNLGQVRYALVLNERAGVLDDVLVYRFEDHYQLVVNASNREKLLAWFDRVRNGFDFELADLTQETAMLAVQGPMALQLAQDLVEPELSSIKYYYAVQTSCADRPAQVSRTGYTGEDGVELVVESDQAEALATRLVDAGCTCCGLGARDTLRLEAGMPLYGHELTEEIDPVQADLGWAVKAKAKDFVGKKALAERPPDRPVRIGLQLEGKRIARQGFSLLHSGDVVGTVTSGTFAPTLQKSLAMGYAPPALSSPGTELEIEIRNTRVPATVVKLPFYQREKD